MNLLDDPKYKTQYHKSKSRVKRWESDFMDNHGRRPTKNDIKSADVRIKEAYKMYWKLKTQALEETLLDITFDDDIEANVSANRSTVTDTPVSNPVNNIQALAPSEISHAENIVPESPVKCPSVKDTVNVDGVWGNHLNKDNEPLKSRKSIPIGKSTSFQLSQRKFSSNFSKRNPRKSLSMSRVKSKTDLNQSCNQAPEPNDLMEPSVETSTSIGSLLEQPIKIINYEEKVTGRAVDPIREMIKGTLVEPTRKLDAGWLNRCVSDSGFESIDGNNKPPAISDEDEFVCNSDAEEEYRNKRIRNKRRTLSEISLKKPRLEPPPEPPVEPFVEPRLELPPQNILPVENSLQSEPSTSSERKEKSPAVKKSKRLSAAKKSTSVVPKKSKPKATERVTRKNTRLRKKEEISDEETIENVDVDDEYYGIESLEVASRFPIPIDSKGDLISEFSQSIGTDDTAVTKTSTKSKGPLTAREKFEAKVSSGKANENFVRLNLKKKIFVRGKKNFNFSKYKKNQWKQKKNDLASSASALDLADLSEKNKCFTCGESGHLTRKCPSLKSDELLPHEEEEASGILTLEEAEKMASELRHEECSDVDFAENFEDEIELSIAGHKIPQHLVDKLLPPINGVVEPLYPLEPDGSLRETPLEVLSALMKFGYKDFRPGQEKAIMRILSGQSTLVTLSTGSGKSLCYQLPAYLFSKKSRCITLVISPLVSLMDDQVTGVPKFIKAAALHTGHSKRLREKILETIKEGDLDILLVSPEAIVAADNSKGFGSILRQLPPIAFVCIDEAHCISQWSHNFRPSYLMVCRVLLEKMGVKTILGLTATATRSTAESIIDHLRIPDGMSGVISDTPLPKNLTLTVSKDEIRDRALLDLLQSKRFEACDSIIIYCTRREECTRIAGLIRVSLQDPKNEPKKKPKVSSIAEAYHAGLPASRRKTIQKGFMNGDTRVVVATVAFGMGINKSNIRAVIHYNMPKSFESYVQEIGRAGRDHLPAHCHLFLSPKADQDKWELRRHIYGNAVDRHTIRRLLQKIFLPCSCRESQRKCLGHEVAVPIDEIVKALDITEETISTLLCYLELHPKKLITVLSSVYTNAKVSSYNGAKALKAAAQNSPPLAMAIALDMKKGISHDDSSVIEFPVVEVAAAIGWDSGLVKSHLKNLEWTTVNGSSKRTSISVRYDTLGLRVRAPGDLTDDELDEALDNLAGRTKTQETTGLEQLEILNTALSNSCHKTVFDCMELNEDTVEKSEALKNIIREYFQSSNPLEIIELPIKKIDTTNEEQIVADIRGLICSYKDNNFTGRAVARIFQGIQSPNYPALIWFRCRYWRAHLATDFNWICQLATREILALR